MFSPYLHNYRGCVPQAVFDSWRHYQWIGSPSEIPLWARAQAFTTPGYSLYDLKLLKADLDEFTAPAPDGTTKTFEEVVAFFDAKREANTLKMVPLKDVENWVKDTERKRLGKNKDVKQQRADFYAEKAAKLHLPVCRSELESLSCFKKAVAILRPANERSWFVLKPKIVEEIRKRKEDGNIRVMKIQEILEDGRIVERGSRVVDVNGPMVLPMGEGCRVVDATGWQSAIMED